MWFLQKVKESKEIILQGEKKEGEELEVINEIIKCQKESPVIPLIVLEEIIDKFKSKPFVLIQCK